MKKYILLLSILSFFSIQLSAQCNALFTYSIGANGVVTLAASGTTTNSIATSYNWTFGNSTTANGANVTAQFYVIGTYTACLKVVDTTAGCADSSCQSIVMTGPACTGTPTGGFLVANTTTPYAGQTTTITVQGLPLNTGYTFQWQRAASCSPTANWSSLPGQTTYIGSFVVNGTKAYRCIVSCTNTGMSDTVGPVCITSSNIPCVPVYATGGNAVNITEVSVNSTFINNTLSAGNPSPYYVDFTGNQLAGAMAIPSLQPGIPNTITVTSPTASQYSGIWIDYNHNGQFETLEFASSGLNGMVNTINLTPPNTPPGLVCGNTRMRIRSSDVPILSTQACNIVNLGNGEAEDYVVYVCSGTQPTCQASFTSTLNITNSLVLSSTSSNAAGVSYAWIINNAIVDTNANFIYSNAPGTYNVCLAINNSITNCSDTFCQTLTIPQPNSCVANYNYMINTITNVVTFVADTTLNLTGATYDWYDGTTLLGSGIYLNNFFLAGTYSICLVINNPNGCTDTSCQNITILAPTCQSLFSYSVYPVNNNITLQAVTTQNQASTTYDWYDGTTLLGSGAFFTYPSLAVGSHIISLVINNPNGCTDTSFQTITISTPTCQAQFTYNTNISNNLTSFYSTSQAIAGTTYDWYDGATLLGSGSTFSYTFPIGSYNICLAINSPNGCTDMYCQLITISSILTCQSLYTYSTNLATNTTTFVADTLLNQIGTTYDWYDGNLYLGSGVNFSTSFPSGNYTICLITTSPNGCIDTSCQTITIAVTPICQANFYIYPNPNGTPHDYIGVNTSTGSNLTYTWFWGDGSSSTGQYPFHTYSNSGNYIITLIVDNGAGCVDTFNSLQYIFKTATMYSVNFGTPTSVKSTTKELATIYPNPAKENFTIKGLATAKYHVEIMNLNGIILKSISANGNQTINISSLANNIYILKITNQDGTTQFAKLIKE